MRAVAVVAVVLFHADVPGAGGGFAGVDVFFVISGFLITGLLIDDGIASALYVGNYWFVAQQVDYFAAARAGSPFQHYWSLASRSSSISCGRP